MADLYVETSRGNDSVDLIVADQVSYNAFWMSLQAIQRITSADNGVRGFRSLAYAGNIPVVLDHDSGIRASTMYFLSESTTIH